MQLQLKKIYPEEWDKEKIAEREDEMLLAGTWKRNFYPKAEPTSLSRATSFSENNVNPFFKNFEDVKDCIGPIPPKDLEY